MTYPEIDFEREALERALCDGLEANTDDAEIRLRNLAKSDSISGMAHTDTHKAEARKAAHKIVQRWIREGLTDEEIATRAGVTATGARAWRDGGKPSVHVARTILEWGAR